MATRFAGKGGGYPWMNEDSTILRGPSGRTTRAAPCSRGCWPARPEEFSESSVGGGALAAKGGNDNGDGNGHGNGNPKNLTVAQTRLRGSAITIVSTSTATRITVAAAGMPAQRDRPARMALACVQPGPSYALMPASTCRLIQPIVAHAVTSAQPERSARRAIASPPSALLVQHSPVVPTSVSA